MSDISTPRRGLTSDRLTECEEAIEAAFQELVWRAMQAGWDEVEVCTAVAMLADHHILAACDNQKNAKGVKRAWKKR